MSHRDVSSLLKAVGILLIEILSFCLLCCVNSGPNRPPTVIDDVDVQTPKYIQCAPIVVDNSYYVQRDVFARNAVVCAVNSPIRITEAMCIEGMQSYTHVDNKQAGLVDFIELTVSYGVQQRDVFSYTNGFLTNAYSTNTKNGAFCTGRTGIIFTCKKYVEGTQREWCLTRWPT